MTTKTWNGGTGDWFAAANWTPAGPPASGDILIIDAGSPTINAGAPDIQNETIELGSVTLTAIEATFGDETTLTVIGGTSSAPVNATLLSKGSTSLEGIILVEAIHGTLTIASQSDGGTAGDFTFVNSDVDSPHGQVVTLVAKESHLIFTGQTFTNDALIQVEGGADIAAGVTFKGNGIIELESGGQLSVKGAVGQNQQIDFDDGTGKLTLAAGSDFHGVIGLTTIGGNRIDLQGVVAKSESFDTSTDELKLFAGPNQTGAVVATLKMQLIEQYSLEPISGDLDTSDFTLGSDGSGGTRITYTPHGTQYVYEAMPTPVVAAPGTLVSLSSILTDSFGTATPFSNIKLLYLSPAANTGSNIGYWDPANAVTQAWVVNGVEQTKNYVVKPGDVVELKAGNEISPISIEVQVTPPGAAVTEIVTYDIWMVDPRVAQALQDAGYAAGGPTPAKDVASAYAFNTTFGAVPNNDYCNLIADNVAAGAGAPVSQDTNYALDPTLNQADGFWRIVYTGNGPSPVSNWSTLVQPGDVVRMGWEWPADDLNASGHSTTVLVGGGPNNTAALTVYDNIYYPPGNLDHTFIGIHPATYWENTDPGSIVIRRLDPKQQYQIQGTNLGEKIQGSVYNNLIQPGGGADTITAGLGNNEIQDTAAHLNGITVTDFHLGDTFDFVGLSPFQTSASYAGGAMHVVNNGTTVATINIPAPTAGQSFAVRSDGNGGSLIGLSVAHAFDQTQLTATLGANFDAETQAAILAYVHGRGFYNNPGATALVQQSPTPWADPFADIAEFSAASFVPVTTATNLSAVIATAMNVNVQLQGSVSVLLAAGGGDNVLIDTGSGNNELLVGSGNNSLYHTGPGNNTIISGAGNDYIYLSGIGTDSVTAGAGKDSIVSVGSGAETLLGGTGDDILLDLGSGNVAMDGGDGNDILNASGSGNETLAGGNGDDVLVAFGSGTIALDGGDGNDSLQSNGTGAQTLAGGNGDDTLLDVSSGGNHSLDGGSGNDIVNDSGASNATLTGGNGHDTLVAFGNGTVRMDGDDGNDSLQSNGTGAETLGGGNGDDTLLDLSGGGNHSLDGGNGNDVLNASGASNDTLTGGSGHDTLVAFGGGTVGMDGGDGNDSLLSIGTGAETLAGGNGNDTLLDLSGGGNHSLDGGAGNDTVNYSGTGNDTLLGGAGTDTLAVFGTGMVSVDTGADDDRIIFGSGAGQNDTLDGGSGTDTVVFQGKSLSDIQTETTSVGVTTIVFSPASGGQTVFVQNVELLRFTDGTQNPPYPTVP